MADYSFDDQSDIAQFTTRHTMRKPDPVFKYDSEDPLDYWSDDWTPLMASDVKDNHLEDSHGWDDMTRGDVNFFRVNGFLRNAFADSN